MDTYGDVRSRHPEMYYPLEDSHSFSVFQVENAIKIVQKS